jgi:hypothetical protein
VPGHAVKILSISQALGTPCRISDRRYRGCEKRKPLEADRAPFLEPPLDQDLRGKARAICRRYFVLFSDGGKDVPPCYHCGQLLAKTWANSTRCAKTVA